MNTYKVKAGSLLRYKRFLSVALAGALATSAFPLTAQVADKPANKPNPDTVLETPEKTYDGYTKALQDLPETVKNNPLSGDAFNAEAGKLNMMPGAITEVNNLGGWNAINGGKLTVARAREDRLYVNSVVGSAIEKVRPPNCGTLWTSRLPARTRI